MSKSCTIKVLSQTILQNKCKLTSLKTLWLLVLSLLRRFKLLSFVSLMNFYNNRFSIFQSSNRDLQNSNQYNNWEFSPIMEGRLLKIRIQKIAIDLLITKYFLYGKIFLKIFLLEWKSFPSETRMTLKILRGIYWAT